MQGETALIDVGRSVRQDGPGHQAPGATARPKPKKPTAEPRPVAVYIRVSSKDQKTDSQRQCISEWLARNGYDLDQVGWFVEVESGRTTGRSSSAP